MSKQPFFSRVFAPANRILLIGAAVALIVLSVWAALTPAGILGKADAVGYAVCHRITIRSFAFSDNRQLPLCARCTGTFLGVLIGLFGPGLVLRRRRMGIFPPWPMLAVLLAFSAAWAFDGANSYTFLLPPGFPHLYTPSNPLRLITGMAHGITMGSVLLPVINSMLWEDVKAEPTMTKAWHLLALLGIGAVACLMVLSELDIFLYPLGILSALGVVTILTAINTVVLTSLAKRENKATGVFDILPMALLGLVVCFLLIGGIDLIRFLATGTWDGFVSPPV